MKKHCDNCSTENCECSSSTNHSILIAILLLLLGIIPGIIYITIKCTEYGLVIPDISLEEPDE